MVTYSTPRLRWQSRLALLVAACACSSTSTPQPDAAGSDSTSAPDGGPDADVANAVAHGSLRVEHWPEEPGTATLRALLWEGPPEQAIQTSGACVLRPSEFGGWFYVHAGEIRFSFEDGAYFVLPVKENGYRTVEIADSFLTPGASVVIDVGGSGLFPASRAIVPWPEPISVETAPSGSVSRSHGLDVLWTVAQADLDYVIEVSVEQGGLVVTCRVPDALGHLRVPAALLGYLSDGSCGIVVSRRGRQPAFGPEFAVWAETISQHGWTATLEP